MESKPSSFVSLVSPLPLTISQEERVPIRTSTFRNIRASRWSLGPNTLLRESKQRTVNIKLEVDCQSWWSGRKCEWNEETKEAGGVAFFSPFSLFRVSFTELEKRLGWQGIVVVVAEYEKWGGGRRPSAKRKYEDFVINSTTYTAMMLFVLQPSDRPPNGSYQDSIHYYWNEKMFTIDIVWILETDTLEVQVAVCMILSQLLFLFSLKDEESKLACIMKNTSTWKTRILWQTTVS